MIISSIIPHQELYIIRVVKHSVCKHALSLTLLPMVNHWSMAISDLLRMYSNMMYISRPSIAQSYHATVQGDAGQL